MTKVPDNLDAILTRDDTSACLTEAGYPTAPATLATKACRGGGPPYRVFGGRALYRWGDALAWAENVAVPTRCSTSEGHRPAA